MRVEHIEDGWWTLPGQPIPELVWPGTKKRTKSSGVVAQSGAGHHRRVRADWTSIRGSTRRSSQKSGRQRRRSVSSLRAARPQGQGAAHQPAALERGTSVHESVHREPGVGRKGAPQANGDDELRVSEVIYQFAACLVRVVAARENAGRGGQEYELKIIRPAAAVGATPISQPAGCPLTEVRRKTSAPREYFAF